MEEQNKIKLLSNEPCREDAFEGHSHQHIAEQLIRIIKNDTDRHIIGIEGGWGSGKSNLISLVNKGLNGDKVYDDGYDHKSSTYPFFVYDAWGHQADYQRRAILEELTHDLTIEKKILDEKKWKKKLEELLAKRRKTKTKEVPKLGIGVVVGIILCALTPLIAFVVELIPEECWWGKLVTSLLPYLLGLGYVYIDRRKSLKDNNQPVTAENILSEMFLVYKDQIKENETYTTISEKEPSSAEFKKWMEEVNKDLIDLKKTLIIVFDNMDRLPSQKVEGLWSSIHSFFSDKTYDNIKVLIPFDRAHVKQAFKSEDAEGESYGNDFINKTFDVVFRVPPPIMSDWQQYMEDKWKDAFGEDAILDISVTQIYDALSKNHTPRKIIAFINEVATIKMTLQETVPDKYIALFIFGKERIDKKPISELLNPQYMGDVKFEYERDRNTIKYLSALYYQLPVNRALDVVFTKEAADALNNGDGKRVNDMMEHIDLSAILSNAILQVIDPEKAVKALADVDSFLDYGDNGNMPGWLAKIWDDLYQKCKQMDIDWSSMKEFHIPLYRHLLNEELAEKLVTSYLSIDDEKWDAKLFVETLDKLRADNDKIDVQLEKHKRKVGAKLFVDLLTYTKDKYEDYGVTFDTKEVDQYLAELEMKEAISLKVIPYIHFKKEHDFLDYQTKLEEWLQNTSLTDIDDVRGLVSRIKEVEEKPLRANAFYSNDLRIHNGWNEICDKNNPFKYDLLAMRIARGNSFNSSYRTAFKNVIDTPDDNDIEGLAKVIEYYINYGDLLVDSGKYKDYPIVVEVVKRLTTHSYGSSQADDIMLCLQHFEETVQDYGMDSGALYSNLARWNEWFDFKKTTPDKMPSMVMTLSLSIDNELTKALHLACDEYYSGLTQDQWKEHMLAEDGAYRIWKLYHPRKYQSNFDALKDILKSCASDPNADLKSKGFWLEWLDVCIEVKHQVRGLFNEISNILKRDSLINKEKLMFFGPLILKYADADQQIDFIEKLIPSEMIDQDVIAFMATVIDKLKGCTVPDEFKEKVKHLGETTMKDDEDVKTICEALRIDMEEEKEDEET